MPDKYASFSALANGEVEGIDFCVRLLKRESPIAVIAPHGGGIEPGTSEIAEAIAGDDLSFYSFDGMKSAGNSVLHITSTRFDEPECLSLVEASRQVIAIHGEGSNKVVIFLGGRDIATLEKLRDSFARSGFRCEKHEDPAMQGTDKNNICNRGQTGAGIQLELGNGLRHSFFESLATRKGRETKTECFDRFVKSVWQAL